MTPSDVAAVQARHRGAPKFTSPTEFSADETYCVYCTRPWPCDAALLLAERERLVEAEQVYVKQIETATYNLREANLRENATLRADLKRCRKALKVIINSDGSHAIRIAKQALAPPAGEPGEGRTT